MRKLLLLILSAIPFGMIFSQMEKFNQTADQAQYKTIISYFDNREYINAIKELNDFIPRYPLAGSLYFTRGLARLRLNDVEGAAKDFLLARGAGFTQNGELIDRFVSQEAFAKMLLKGLKNEGEVDPERGFKLKIEPKDTLQGGLRRERTCFDVFFYDLTVKVIPETKSIEGSNTIYFKGIFKSPRIQLDLFPEYELSSITMNGRELSFERVYGSVFITLPEELVPGQTYSLKVEYKGMPRVAPKPPWNGGFVWEKIKNRHYIGVACEHLGASSWWPVKDHLSDKPDSMRINLQVPEGYQGISNGNLRSTKDLGNSFTNFEWFVSYPINSYNVTLYVGDFVNFNETITSRNGDLRADYYVLEKNLEKAKKYYSQIKDIVGVYEDLFGPYPFPKDGLGMVESPYEGMEHQGAIAIGGEYGKSGRKREMWPENFDYLLVHETGHEWWGNAVAIGDMADAWINEGFTTYAECLLAEVKGGYGDYVKMISSKMRYVTNLYPMVGETGINENTFLSGDIYHKGASMLNNLRCIMDNDSVFKKMIKDFYLLHSKGITTTGDFVKHVGDYTKADPTGFFRKFLYDSSPPVLFCSHNLDPNGSFSFSYRWLNTGPNFSMPVALCLNGKDVVKLNATTELQIFRAQKVKSFLLLNEHNLPDKLTVPKNCLTFYNTRWPLL